ncbi:MAG: D-aminoacyl-tRNA deacylase [Desulfurococcales archaeon]|nr:D-aminoacyl-tRNA deacylase [Desulfurococcales archaeon]
MKPKLAIVYNVSDPAGSGAAEKLLQLQKWNPSKCANAVTCYELPNRAVLAGYEVEQIYFDFLDNTPDPEVDAVIVLSKHSAVSNRPSLTTHHTGNPTSSTLGGEPYTLSVSAPMLSRTLLSNYKITASQKGLLDTYELTLEATHHGPTRPRKPLVFIEIGSTKENWVDERAHWAMAEAVAEVIEKGIVDCTPAVGFGDTHYPRKFTKIHLESEYCLGHIIPRYALKDTNEKVIIESVKKTWPREPEVALIQKKSAKAEVRNKIKSIMDDLGIEVKII